MAKIKDIPLNERPREKALRFGINSLSINEILAIIIGSGTKDKSALDIADELLSTSNGLINLTRTNLTNLTKIKGINKISALRILACFELAFKIIQLSENSILDLRQQIKFIATKYQKLLLRNTNEEMHLIIFNKHNQIIKETMLYKGTKSNASVSINEIIDLVKINAGNKFIIIHNHPNNAPEPSDYDLAFTYDLINLAEKEHVKLIDHIIVSEFSYNSILGLLE